MTQVNKLAEERLIANLRQVEEMGSSSVDASTIKLMSQAITKASKAGACSGAIIPARKAYQLELYQALAAIGRGSSNWMRNFVFPIPPNLREGPSVRFYAGSWIIGNLEFQTLNDLGQLVYHGVQRDWYTNGGLSGMHTYHNGWRHGVSRVYNPSGHLLTEAMHDMGILVGKQSFWDGQGNLLQVKDYGLPRDSDWGCWQLSFYPSGLLRTAIHLIENPLEVMTWADGEPVTTFRGYPCGSLLTTTGQGESND